MIRTIVLACLLAAGFQTARAQAPAPGDPANVQGITAALPPPGPDPSAGPRCGLENPAAVRAVVVDSLGPALKSPEAVRKMVRQCRDAGFNTIFAQVRTQGDALYRTSHVPPDPAVSPGFDPLKTLLDEARGAEPPLRVYAMLTTLRVWTTRGGEPPELHVARRHPDWLTQLPDGTQRVGEGSAELWLDPGVVAVQDHLALVAADLVRNYEVEGILLDRLRYPDTELRTGYNRDAVERFNQQRGKGYVPAPDEAEWISWRRTQVTETLRKTREAVRGVKPGAKVAVNSVTYGPPPANAEEYRKAGMPYTRAMSDWLGWCETGLADMNVLMNYKAADTRAAEYDGWLGFAAANKGKARLVVGVAGWMNASRQASAMMLDAAFVPDVDGVALYGYHLPAKQPETAEDALVLYKKTLDPNLVATRAHALAAAAAQPGGDRALARLNLLADALSGDNPGTLVSQPGVPAYAAPLPPALLTPETDPSVRAPSAYELPPLPVGSPAPAASYGGVAGPGLDARRSPTPDPALDAALKSGLPLPPGFPGARSTQTMLGVEPGMTPQYRGESNWSGRNEGVPGSGSPRITPPSVMDVTPAGGIQTGENGQPPPELPGMAVDQGTAAPAPAAGAGIRPGISSPPLLAPADSEGPGRVVGPDGVIPVRGPTPGGTTPPAGMMPGPSDTTAPGGAYDMVKLKNGKEFEGRVLQEGKTWQIELRGGGVIRMPANRVERVRRAGEAAPSTPPGRGVPSRTY